MPLFDRKKLTALIWPLLVEQLLSVLVGMADVLMVAFLGEAAISGVSLVDALCNLFMQVLFALSAGGTVVCAQLIGAGKPDRAARAGGQLYLITVTAMTAVMLFFLAGGRRLLGLLYGQADAAVMDAAALYFRITAFSFPLLAVYNAGIAIFRAQGNTKLSMTVSLRMNILNVIGNAFCIFVLKMGVAGVAIPTVLARGYAAAVITRRIQRPENPLRLRSLADLKPEGELLRRVLSIGLPNGMKSGLFRLGTVLLQSLVSTLGTASIAAYAVANNLATYLYLPGNAIGAAMITVVGQCYGAKEYGQAKRYTKLLVGLDYAIAGVIAAVLIMGSRFWVGLYQLTGESASLARGLITAHSAAMVIWPTAFMFAYYFRAIGKATFTMWVAVSAMWIFRIGLAYLFVRVLGMNVLGVWYAMFVDWIFRTVIYLMKFPRSLLAS